MKFYHKKYLFYLYVIIIFLLSLIPGDSVKSIQIFGIDKIIHLIEYFILGVIYKYSIINNKNIHYFLILIIPLLDEYCIQRFSNRSIDFWDFIFL